MTADHAPEVVDRSRFFALMNDSLTIAAPRTAVVTVDCHRGHLDPAVATMPVAPQAAARVVAATARLVRFARSRQIPVIHVILHNRILPDGTSEPLRNPFWSTVEGVDQMLTPERPSTISRHNVVGSPQTELMPELGPDPADIVIRTKRRLSIFRDTDLDLTLHELGTDTLILAGINTNTCITCAAFESLNRDLKTIVAADCVHSMYGDDLHFFGLQNIARCLGWVLPVEQVIDKVEAGLAGALPAR